MKKIIVNNQGQTVIEYAFIIFLLVSLFTVSIPTLRDAVIGSFNKVVAQLDTSSQGEFPIIPPDDEDPGSGENITWFPPELDLDDDNVIYSAENINLSGGAKIYGNVVTNGNVVLGWGSFVEGEIYDNANYEFNFPLPVYPVISKDSVPSKGTYTAGWGSSMPTSPISESGYYSSLQVLSNLTFNTGNEGDVLTIIVDSLEVTGSGKINVEGNGKLVIKVNDNLTFTNSASLNDSGVPDNVVMYYSGTNSLNLGGGNQKFVGSIYTETSGVNFSGGSSSIKGNIIVGGNQVVLSGGSTPRLEEALLYAPNADINLSGGSSVKGRVIAKSITGSGNSSITFKPVVLDDIFSWELTNP